MSFLVTSKEFWSKKVLNKRFIRNAIHVYQPIYDINQSVIIGCEVLMRNITSKTITPLSVFNKAREQGIHRELDFHLLHSAQRNIDDEIGILFLNVFPSTLLMENFIEKWDQTVQYNNIVLELNQIEAISEWNLLKEVLLELKQRGIKVAIDGVGDKFSSLKRLVELQPDYIKIDRYFAKNLSDEKIKQNVIKYLLQAFGQKTKLILEGIEEEKDLYTAQKLGITYAQGYYLGKPMLYEKLYQQVANNKRDFYFHIESSVGQLQNKEQKIQKVEIVKNNYSNQYYDMNFEIPLCTRMELIEINEKKINSGKTNVCVSKISPNGLEFLSRLKLPSDANIKLNFQTTLSGYPLNIKGNVIDSSEIQDGTYRYIIHSIGDEREFSENIKILNDFQISMRKRNLVHNTNFCGKDEKDRCIYLK